LLIQIGDFNLRKNLFVDIEIRKEKLMNRLLEKYQSRFNKEEIGMFFDARNLWSLYLPCELAIVALAILDVNPSEASVERTFSSQKFVHSKLRNRLSKSNIEEEMMIRFNMRKAQNCFYDEFKEIEWFSKDNEPSENRIF
jgi:hypothetical protein